MCYWCKMCGVYGFEVNGFLGFYCCALVVSIMAYIAIKLNIDNVGGELWYGIGN